MSKREFGKAIGDFQEVVRLDPKSAKARCNCATVRVVMGVYDKALADYNEALRLDPKNPHTYQGRASVWKAKRDYQKAVADLDEAILLSNSRDPWGFYGRGMVWSDKKEYDKAIADYSAALKLNPLEGYVYKRREHGVFPEKGLRKRPSRFRSSEKVGILSGDSILQLPY